MERKLQELRVLWPDLTLKRRIDAVLELRGKSEGLAREQLWRLACEREFDRLAPDQLYTAVDRAIERELGRPKGGKRA